MNDKAVVQGYARICLHKSIAVAKTNFDARDFHRASSISAKPNDDEIEEDAY